MSASLGQVMWTDENADAANSPSKNRRAYFGFRYVNGDKDLGENGPEPVYPY